MFIVLDGLDGSGKGEMIKRLNKYLVKQGFNVLVTKEPTDGEYGKQIKEILKNEKDPKKGAKKCLDLFVKESSITMPAKVLKVKENEKKERRFHWSIPKGITLRIVGGFSADR